MAQKRILLLGAGLMQLPAIKIAKRKGWFVVAADGNAQALGREFVDAFEHIDLKDKEGLASCASLYLEEGGLDGVFTAGTDFSASVAWVAEKFALPGISYETALNASVKSRMRRVLRDAGVPVPRFAEVLSIEEAREAARSLDYPLVVKPVDNMGARGCRKIGSPGTLAEATSEALAYSRSGTAILEDFLEGPEYSIDALVEGGRIVIRGIADRHIHFSPYFIEMGHTLPAKLDDSSEREILRVFKAAIRAIGIDRGAAKGDVKLTSKGPFIGEIAARLSGGYMSGWTYPYASGIEVTEEALEIAVGNSPAFASIESRGTSAERAVISIPGKVASVIGIEAARAIPGVRDVFMKVQKGDSVVFPSNNVEKCGNVIASSIDREGAILAAEEAVRAIRLELEPRNEKTEGFLHGNDRILEGADAYPPDAYSFEEPELSRLVADMPEYLARSRKGSLSICPLPSSKAMGRKDWHGRIFSESLILIAESRPIDFGGIGDTVLAGRFWRAFLRGGYQAGLYVIDTELSDPR